MKNIIPDVLARALVHENIRDALTKQADAVIGGSCALFMLGLTETQPNDIDIIVPSHSSADALAKKLGTSGANRLAERLRPDHSLFATYSFTTRDSVKLDILVPCEAIPWFSIQTSDPAVRIQDARTIFAQLAEVSKRYTGATKYAAQIQSIINIF